MSSTHLELWWWIIVETIDVAAVSSNGVRGPEVGQRRPAVLCRVDFWKYGRSNISDAGYITEKSLFRAQAIVTYDRKVWRIDVCVLSIVKICQ